MIESGISPVGDPKLDLDELPGEGEPLKFAIEVNVLPEATLGEYKGLEVGRQQAEVPKEAVDAELERLREGFAKLNPVERAAAEGDVLLIDYEGKIDGEPFEGGEAKDYLLELGAGRVLPEFEAGADGREGRRREDRERHLPRGLPGRGRRRQERRVHGQRPRGPREGAARAERRLRRRGVRVRHAGRTARAHLRAHSRVHSTPRSPSNSAQAPLDAAVANATVELPDQIVQARAEEMWGRVERQLQARGMDPNAYLQMQGKTREELIAEAKPEAEQALRREAVLRAVADTEGIEVDRGRSA